MKTKIQKALVIRDGKLKWIRLERIATIDEINHYNELLADFLSEPIDKSNSYYRYNGTTSYNSIQMYNLICTNEIIKYGDSLNNYINAACNTEIIQKYNAIINENYDRQLKQNIITVINKLSSSQLLHTLDCLNNIILKN